MAYNLHLSLNTTPSRYAPTKRMDRKAAKLFRERFPLKDRDVWSSRKPFRALMKLRDGTVLRWATSTQLDVQNALFGANRSMADVVKFRSWAV